MSKRYKTIFLSFVIVFAISQLLWGGFVSYGLIKIHFYPPDFKRMFGDNTTATVDKLQFENSDHYLTYDMFIREVFPCAMAIILIISYAVLKIKYFRNRNLTPIYLLAFFALLAYDFHFSKLVDIWHFWNHLVFDKCGDPWSSYQRLANAFLYSGILFFITDGVLSRGVKVKTYLIFVGISLGSILSIVIITFSILTAIDNNRMDQLKYKAAQIKIGDSRNKAYEILGKPDWDKRDYHLSNIFPIFHNQIFPDITYGNHMNWKNAFHLDFPFINPFKESHGYSEDTIHIYFDDKNIVSKTEIRQKDIKVLLHPQE
ncbi:MAG TPA: hypothetical protein DCZ94_17300 [Lentisphaeria bacterium]|nr:MAG: hypothetical protein A2X48_20880 [Lentisphaerae bacterium GWF2_49_21]HBC88702.1 hypothetical protein [Lentisphaeria bacterium]